jgi:3-dehydroquinate dehydratase II
LEAIVKVVRVLHGPSLNLLGKREPEVYGTKTLDQIDEALADLADELGLAVEAFQTNDESRYVELIQEASETANFLVLNPAALTHTSISVRDALQDCGLPSVEVHLSNVYAREPFRHVSHIADLVLGRIMGLGLHSYLAALRFAAHYLDSADE